MSKAKTQQIPLSYYSASPRRKRIKSFEDYLRSVGEDYEDEYGKELEESATEREAALAGYGTLGESLSRSGLTSSGYSRYLDAQAKRNASAREAMALSVKDEAQLRAEADYSSYLEKADKELATLRDRVVERVVKEQLTDLNKANIYALEEGLDRDEALEVARSAVTSSKEAIAREILYKAISDGLGTEQTEDYATEMGLDREQIKRLVKYVKDLQGGKVYRAEEFIELIEKGASTSSGTHDRLANLLEEYIKLKLEERNNSNEKN